MKFIPDFYQELDCVLRVSSSSKANCICFFSPDGEAGVSSLTLSVAKRLSASNNKVLVLDLNHHHPISSEWPAQKVECPQWRFDTISTQLSPYEYAGLSFLSVAQLSCANSARDENTVRDAFERWMQEYDYVLVDSSPLLQVNQSNLPSRVFARAANMSVLVVSAGKTSEESLVKANEKLDNEGFKNINIVLSQFAMPPLGPRLLRHIDRLRLIPSSIKNKLTAVIRKQAWLFRPIGT